MKRLLWPLILIGLPVIFCLGLFAYVGVRSGQERAAYEEQLRLARAEGLPTNATEYAAYIPTCEPKDNAGMLYRRLDKSKLSPADYVKVYRAVAVSPTTAATVRARAILDSARAEMSLVDQGTRLPHCWFDRDWSQGGPSSCRNLRP